ncbi:MAG: hypothetical protein ACI9RU_000310 [Litorivivens sp.]
MLWSICFIKSNIMKHKLTQVNAGSMDDIDFLLLVFLHSDNYTVHDKGLLRVLPGMDDKVSDVSFEKFLRVAINANGELMANNQEVGYWQLGVQAKKF